MDSQSYGFDDVLQLKWLLLVLACAAAYVYGFAMKRRGLLAFASAGLLAVLAPNVSRGRQIVRAGLVLSAMVLIVLGLIGPRWGMYWEDVQQRRLDLMICLDVSRSMLARDAGMSRLDRAKDDIQQLLDALAGSRVGLVTFAGTAELSCPLTDDYAFYRLMLDDVGPQTVSLGGTNLGRAIDAAAKGFGDATPERKAIILLTDGEDHADRGERAAAEAKKLGISVFAIGIGDDERGGLIPIEKDGQQTYLKYEGQQVWSKLDPTSLKAIARAGGGEYHPSRVVNSTQRTLEWVYDTRLWPQEERTMQQKRVRRLYAQFHWLAAGALMLLIIEPLVSERRGGRPAGVPK